MATEKQPDAPKLTSEQQRQKEIADKTKEQKNEINKADAGVTCKIFEKNKTQTAEQANGIKKIEATVAPKPKTAEEIKQEKVQQEKARIEKLTIVKNTLPEFKGGYDQVTNILRDNYGITSLDMEKIQTLSDSAKANVAYFMVMLSPITPQEKNALGKDLGAYYSRNSGEQVNPSESKRVREKLVGMRHDAILKTYSQMYKGEVPLMPDLYNLATGDGSATSGIGGKDNGNRELFEYPERGKMNEQINYLKFGMDKKPMEVSVVANGADASATSHVGLAFQDAQGKVIGALRGTYNRQHGLQWVKEGSMATENQLDTSKNTITIPEKYRNSRITLYSNSGGIGNGYDEVLFSVGIKNGRKLNQPDKTPIEHAGSDDYDNQAKDPMELGKYDLKDDAKQKISGILDDVLFYGNKTLKQGIKLNVNIGADQTSFIDANAAKTEYTAFKEQKSGELGNILKTKFTPLMEKFSNSIKISPSLKGEQAKAQKLLIECRFLNTLSHMVQNKELVKQIESGKFDIVGNPINAKERFISLVTESMQYATS